ncbi:MAG: hypothetical protein UT20_C0013G0007 [Candidatus Levybacteria bacterium GW2011_GWA1_39_11]|nr:MAG: hypothetical protein UT20_C0013G0007 [Candidatus Levybacteria bacterium GW2011_GWA1_39_11]
MFGRKNFRAASLFKKELMNKLKTACLPAGRVLLIIIFILALFFRFFNLSSIPPQPTVDEVSIGYNAYSILKTGADEYGNKFPILLRAYDDYRPALYVYLAVPFVGLFGLNPLAVRLPSVILSTLSVIAVYFLIKELAIGAKSIRLGKSQLDLSFVTTCLFAISPWHIYISRLGHEVNASFSFLIFGLLFFLRFINKQKWNLYLSALFFGLSFNSYQSTKLVAPLILAVLAILHFKTLIANKKTVIISAIIGFIVALPILSTSFDQNALIRFKATNLLEYSVDYFKIQKERLDENRAKGDLVGVLFDNRKVASGLLISKAYLSHLNPQWLFLNEGGEQFKAPALGLLYLFELPLSILGLLFLTRTGIPTKTVIFIFAWSVIAIIPGAITTGYAHPMRIFSILPVPQIFAAVGFLIFINYFQKFRPVVLAGSVFVAFIFALWFFHSYFTLVPRELSSHFQYGILNAFARAEKIEDRYEKVVVSNTDRLFESYMFYLYYKRYDPELYQKIGGTVSGGFAEEHRIDNYVFGRVDDKISKNTLYIINPHEEKEFMRVLYRIPYLNGETALLVAEIK